MLKSQLRHTKAYASVDRSTTRTGADSSHRSGKKRICVAMGSAMAALFAAAIVAGAVIAVWQVTKRKPTNNANADTKAVEYSKWDNVVKTHVSVGQIDNVTINVVDYCGIKADPFFDQVVNSWSTANTSGFSQDEVLAFYINAYNIFTIRTIIDHARMPDGRCIKGILDVGFDVPITVAGRNTTLDQIELLLRHPRKYGWGFDEDCRIHGCIVCASVSCPNVRQEAYRPGDIDAQMSDNVRNWLNSTYKGAAVDKEALVLSKIFAFFPDDFAQPSCQGSVVNFVGKYASGNVAAFIAQKHPTQFSFFTKPKQTWHGKAEAGYNWNLNGKVPCDC